MKEFFIKASSFAAPFFSDDSTHFQSADTPEEALTKFAKGYKHPFGLYAASCYESAEAYHKAKKPLSQWLCNHEMEKSRLTKKLGSYSYRGLGPGDFEIDGVRHTVDRPKEGTVVVA